MRYYLAEELLAFIHLHWYQSHFCLLSSLNLLHHSVLYTMAELVGGAVLSSFLQVAFDRLASRETIHYFQTRGLNETLVTKLNYMLRSIDIVIDDAECRQFSDSNVKAWLCDLKDTVYDAEDVLDEVNYQVYKHKMEAEADTQTSIASKVWKRLSASTSSFDQEIETRMKQVLESLEFLESRKIDLGLKQSKGGVVGSVTKLRTTSLVDEDGIYGRNKDKEIIISQLLNDKHFSVISIVGVGGLGKTTIAQLVYNDERIKRKFDIPVWVCVSVDFDVLRLTKLISKKIRASNDDIEDLDTLHNKLKDKLSGKKFLIVLDDVWCDEYRPWEALLAPFNICGAAGSRILVTSRHDSVAFAARSVKPHRPLKLSDEDGWLLFTKYACGNSCPQTNPDLEAIGRRIVKQCNGLPLALKTIGSVLYGKSSLEEWNSIWTSELWSISCKNILPALLLSYHYLPSHLKRCFAYCSLFPKDYVFEKEKLVALWMAQDFLQASQLNKSIEDAGNEAFEELVSRSFFQKSSEKETHFVMHDIINDLAFFVAGEFYFKQELQEVSHISKKTRHLSFLVYMAGESRQFEYLQNIKKLRTFLPLLPNPSCIFIGWTSSDIFGQLCKCKYLRFLSFAYNHEITEIPDSIRDLIHLRHLDLSYSQIKRIPESICLLYNLQTLKLANCRHLDELPTGLHNLKNLRQLDLRKTGLRKIPPNLAGLKNLRVCLSEFYVGEHSELNIKQIGELNLQGELSIYELHNVVARMDALKANLKEKKHLEQLSFQWNENNNDDSQNERDVLEKLQPHRNLKKLSIRYYGGTRFPDWFADRTILPNIVSLRLESCKYCYTLPSLGLLPSLKSLFIETLDGIVTIGAEFFGGNSCTFPFKSLEILVLAEMVNWKEWDCMTAPRAFPCLKVLCIRDCPKLIGNLPQQLASLEDLAIEDSPGLVASVPWAPLIRRLSLGNCEHVRLEYAPSTLTTLCFRGPCGNVSLLEKIEHTVNNSSIEEVKILNCPDWEFPLKQHYDSLHEIEIERSCASLRTFALDLFPALKWLSLKGCKNLETISILDECNHVPTSLLTYLTIEECPKFISLPERINIFAPSLTRLDINDCPQMESFPEGGLPSKLGYLDIDRCPKLFACPTKWGLHNLGSLHSLLISGDDVVECLPEPGLIPTSLEYLYISGCSNLRMLDYNALCQAPSLRDLNIRDCPRLQCLPKEGLPSSLSFLAIDGDCPELKQRCQEPNGEDWPKISHIPDVRIF